MTEVNLEYKYPEFMLPALQSKAKHIINPQSRRNGKTFNWAQWICENTIATGDPGLWVDTTHSMIEKYIERYFKHILKPIWKYCHYDKQKQILKLPGTYIDFGSANKPENIEGMAYRYGVVNEAGIVLRKAELWDNTLQPMFKSSDSQVAFVGTPKGKNLFNKLFVMGKDPLDDNYASFRYSIYDSPFWTPDQIKMIKDKAPQNVWDQEYLAKFLDDAGMVFRGIRANIKEQRKSSGDVVMGIDFAKHQDFTVIVVMDAETHHVVGFDRFNEISWPLQKQRIINQWKEYGKPSVILDANSIGDVILDDFENIGMDVTGFKINNTSKQQLILNLSAAIESGEISYPELEVLLDELESFEYTITKTGKVSYNAPEGLHDDAVIALALAWELVRDYEPLGVSFA